MVARCLLAIVAMTLATGCQKVPDFDRGPGIGVTGDDPETELPNSDPTNAGQGSAEGNEAGNGGGNNSTDPDASPADPDYDCDPTSADACQDDERCVPLLDGGTVERFACVDDPPRLMAWDDCTPVASGRDGCPSGYTCLDDGDSPIGICVPLCDANAECERGECRNHDFTGIEYCEIRCNPLASECPRRMTCRENQNSFGCGIVARQSIAELGEGCGEGSHGNECSSGTACISGSRLIGCNENHCCADLCRLSEDECETPTSCHAFLQPPIAPELEDVGACIVPTAQ